MAIVAAVATLDPHVAADPQHLPFAVGLEVGTHREVLVDRQVGEDHPSLGYVTEAAGDDLVGLVVFGRDVQTYLPPRKGRSQFLAILDALYRVEGEPVASR